MVEILQRAGVTFAACVECGAEGPSVHITYEKARGTRGKAHSAGFLTTTGGDLKCLDVERKWAIQLWNKRRV